MTGSLLDQAYGHLNEAIVTLSQIRDSRTATYTAADLQNVREAINRADQARELVDLVNDTHSDR